ncbi:ADP-ribose pyrophosphatase [Aureliella helgolandensis]|uniref:GDP-mannose pyrophosphatase n=1 Tax=Aureliella helgolandensis TaxID=2527968 RepID=A0A518G6Z8_9BACT|nr:ADP-ribose pyrophosphatase [Aureliella helgolandensis]
MESSKKPERQTLLTSDRFTVERVTQTLHDGRQVQKDVVLHPGAVVIIPVLDDGRVCLIRNYRIAVEQELLELPAGTLEPPEPPLEAARRELVEETGFRCQSLTLLCEFYMSPGILNERMYAYVATGLTPGAQALEIGEQIAIQPVELEELDGMLRDGQIQDSKSMSALFYFLRYHR